MANTIAQTILAQLGGNQFVTMTGANHLVASSNGLYFRIGRNATKCNLVKIELTANDTYTMQFWNQPREANIYTILVNCYEKGMTEEQTRARIEAARKRSEPKVLRQYDEVYCDQLQDLFTEYTKLRTSLF